MTWASLPAALLVVLVFRLLTLFFIFPDARHGFTGEHLSTAIGLLEGAGMTTSWSEIQFTRKDPSNITLNMDGVYFPLFRERFDRVLPLPTLTIALVWKVTGIRSTLVYLLFMILVELAVLVPFLLVVRNRVSPRVMFLTALLLALNVPLGRLVVSVSYDIYAYYGSVLAFVAGVYLLENRHLMRMVILSALSSITILGREINLLLYPILCAAGLWPAIRERSRRLAVRAFLFLLPFLVVSAGVMVYRQITTGNPRPTRSMLWHSVWLGVGQFPNPYGLIYDDGAVIDYALKIDPTLEMKDYSDDKPNSHYEQSLRTAAKDLVARHPWLLVRNTIYRTGIVISPFLYNGGDSVPARFAKLANIVSPLVTIALAAGLFLLYRRNRVLPAVILLTLAAMIVSFAWFYIVGRVVLLASHVYALPLAMLMSEVWRRIRREAPDAAGGNAAA